MTIYYSLILFIGVFSAFTLGMRDKSKRNKIVIIVSSILIILVQGLRRISVGVDLSGYIPAYGIAKDMDFFGGDKLFNYEIGYSLYSQLFSKLNVSDQGYLFIIAITIFIPIAYIWMKKSKLPGLSVLIYITLGFFTFSFSGLRQSIAISIAFFSFKYIYERKIVKFLLCIIIAMSFHTSAIIFILAYPLYYIRLNKNHFYLIIPFLGGVFLFRAKIFSAIYQLYKGYPGTTEVTNAYTMLIVMIIVLLLSYIFGSKNNSDLNFNSYKNYLLVAIFIQIFASQSNVVMRAGYYYYIFITLLIPEVIKNQKDARIRLLASSILVVMLLYFFHKTTGNGYLNVSPYHFYWE